MEKIPVRQISATQKEAGLSARFSIRDVETVMGGADLFHKRHRHDFFFILALQKGEGIHEIDFEPHAVLDNSVFFLRPGQVHQLQLKAGGAGYLMEFNTEFYHLRNHLGSQRLRKASNKNVYMPAVARFNKIHAILTTIFQEYIAKEEGYQDAIIANLDILFIELVRQDNIAQTHLNKNNSYTQERLEEFLELIEIHAADHKQVSHYTDLMNLSAYQLNEITKGTIGKTASEIINDHIILEAKRYLLGTSSQVKDIAYHLGFEDVSYFIRFFKKHTGYSPESFRHNFR